MLSDISTRLLSLSAMPRTLDPELRRALAARIRYYNEMGIYDFYRRPAVARRESEVTNRGRIAVGRI